MGAALLVIDVQRGLFDSEPRPFDAHAVVERINQLAARARAAHAPVIYIQHERASGFLQAGSDSWALYRGLTPEPGDHRLRKTTPDAFLRTELSGMLAAAGVTRLVVCGYATEFCVDSTARRAAALGFAVTLAADAHTTHDKDHASAALIRAHHNATLPGMTSFGPLLSAVPAAAVDFGAAA